MESLRVFDVTPLRVISGVEVELDIDLMFGVHIHKVCTLWGLVASDDRNVELDAKVRLAGLLWDDYGQPREAVVVPNPKDDSAVSLDVKVDGDDWIDVGVVLLREGLVSLGGDSPYRST